jgi:ubiquinone/menaquinone biosynthesis C-methylase UbiE
MFGVNYTTTIDPLLRDMREFIPDFAAMKPGNSVLDVCCGSGAQVYEYNRRGLVATGLDGSVKMLAMAAKYFDVKESSKSIFKLADASHLPFVDESFDFTSISLALHEKEIWLVDMILSEMMRVTRRGGCLVFADFSLPLPHNLVGYAIRGIETLAGREHFRCFRNYIKTGGLYRILRKSKLIEVKETRMKGRSITLILARNN